MDAGELWISVRLRQPAMMPAEITSAMGVERSVPHPVGGQRMTPSRRDLNVHYSETIPGDNSCGGLAALITPS